MRNNRTTSLALGCALFAATAFAQSDAVQAGARDAFRKAKERFYVAQQQQQKPPPAPKPQASAPRPRPQAPPPARTRPAPPRAEVVAVSDRPGPLGLRYSLRRQAQDGSLEEVDADTTFRTGDRIRLHVESSDRGYLYVVNQGASGRWNLLFPQPGMPAGLNRIEPGHPRTTPEDGWFEFDSNVGEEKLFLMLSRTPVAELEQRLRDPRPARPHAAPAPAEQPRRMAIRAELNDEMIAQYRDRHSRDIIFQKVSSLPASSQSSTEIEEENAVYVVTQSTDPQARVVTDVTLTHR